MDGLYITQEDMREEAEHDQYFEDGHQEPEEPSNSLI